MALTTEIRCRIDQQLKDDAQKVLDQVGLSISQAIRIFFRQVVVAGGMPFDLKTTVTRARQVRARYSVKARATPRSKGKKRPAKKRSRNIS